MSKNLVLLRYTDPRGRRLAALCRPKEGVETLREIVGEMTDADREWFEDSHESAVVIDTDGAVVVTSSEELRMLAFWFGIASAWLQNHGG